MDSDVSPSTTTNSKRPKNPSKITHSQIDKRLCDIIERALREHFRITACDVCGGPRIHSKLRPHSKCLRCGDSRVTASILPFPTKQRCRRCKTYHWRVLRSLYCERCQKKVAQEGVA
jgi:hypothetical protein